ncbi:hypothetical protein [Alloscardovia omnicolens]|uniref:hypothetical protein n=1 Tax=Alloscardovia omnicolens TaxID=419015 RepID=UPI00288AC8EE|nr:hypothetical protein [Alloscardovia omnicolens]
MSDFVYVVLLATQGLDYVAVMTGDDCASPSQFCQSAYGETRHVERILSHNRQNTHSKHGQPTSTKTKKNNPKESATSQGHATATILENKQ